jgi:hypothetical protein
MLVRLAAQGAGGLFLLPPPGREFRQANEDVEAQVLLAEVLNLAGGLRRRPLSSPTRL